MREYSRGDTTEDSRFSVHVGFYDRQSRGKTIHSPKNCLPGGGWEPLTSALDTIETACGPARANRYLLRNDSDEVLVLYWYQGRVQASEYAVKWQLLRDAVARRPTDESLARVVVPVDGDLEAATSLAKHVAAVLIPALYDALP
jgi:EpsI family protein